VNSNLQLDLHPDADSLSAFAEQALGVAEREQILAHMTRCSRCRQVIYLAQKAAQAEALEALSAMPSGRWYRSWRFAWFPPRHWRPRWRWCSHFIQSTPRLRRRLRRPCRKVSSPRLRPFHWSRQARVQHSSLLPRSQQTPLPQAQNSRRFTSSQKSSRWKLLLRRRVRLRRAQACTPLKKTMRPGRIRRSLCKVWRRSRLRFNTNRSHP